MLHPVEDQVYKLEFSKKWRIHDVFYVSLLEQDTTRKRWVDDENAAELDVDNDKEYKIEVIQDSAVYVKEVDRYLLGLYYLVSWKRYPEEENT